MNTGLLQYFRIAISLLTIGLTSLACLSAEIQVSSASVTPAPTTISAAPTPATISATPIIISATELYQEREANATRFDQNFKGKRVLIIDIIDSIDGGQVRLRVDSSFLGDVSLHDLPVAVQVRANKGEEFSAVCTVDSYIIATMNLRDCQERQSDDDSQTAVTTIHTPIADKVTTATGLMVATRTPVSQVEAANVRITATQTLTLTPTLTTNPTPKLASTTLATATPTSSTSPIPATKDTEPADKPQPASQPESTQTQSPLEPTATAAPTPVDAPDADIVELPSFGPGTHLVGQDVQPGVYRAKVADSFFPLCTWSRLSGLNGSFGSIIATKIVNEGFTYTRVKETDLAFESSGCTDFTLHQPGTSPSQQFGPGTFLVGSDIHAGLYKSEPLGGLLTFFT